jgi:hypothetical protein
MTEPTEGAKEELRLAAEAYASRSGTDPYAEAEVKTGQVMGQLAAQRGANRLWGTPPESRGE